MSIDFAAEVAELRTELAALREQMETEVRTRRVVVVDSAGVERIVAEVVHDSAEVAVYCAAPANLTDERTMVKLYASHDDDSDSTGLFATHPGFKYCTAFHLSAGTDHRDEAKGSAWLWVGEDRII